MPDTSRKDVAAVLLELTHNLSDGRSLEDALRCITDAAVDLLSADHASIRLYDASRVELLTSARSGRGSSRGSVSLKRGEGIAGWVLEHGQPARVDDVTKDSRFLPAVGQGFRIASMLVEPLMSAGRAIGVLSVSSEKLAAFSTDDELLARLLANCSVPPIERSRLERLTITDDTTLALDRRCLFPQLRGDMERWHLSGMTISYLAMNLDNFKRVNEIYGQTMGDRVLRIFADRVRAYTRVFDALVRTGGDEFALIMSVNAPDQAKIAAQRVREKVGEEPMQPLQGGFITQTVSIGVSTWDGRESPEDLKMRAETALREAKEKGKDRVAVAPDSVPAASRANPRYT